MAISVEFLSYVVEQLSAVRGITSRRMFGGVGLYCEGVFFGLIMDDVLYFRAGDENRADYEARGMRPFHPIPGKLTASTSYFELPADVLEDGEECRAWALRGVAAARVKTGRSRKRPPNRAQSRSR
jgi:DNA transformation protein